MELKMICGTWIKEEDEKVLEVLRQSDTWLTAEELSGITGLPLGRVERTLSMLHGQMRLYRGRMKFLEKHPFV